MKYISIAMWRDLEDKHLYNSGDKYPHDDREVSEDRIAELSSKQNKAGFALIKAVEESCEEKPIEKAEQPKKATRSRKKA